MANDLQLSIELNKLSKPEQIALDHFKKKPEGRGFFAVAEILIRHERIEEAIQLLTEGLERHPHYSVARVYLSQLLFRKHFYREAWDALEASPSSLRTNLTAQILRLKLCVMLGFESQARSLCRELGALEFQDPEARMIIEKVQIKPFAQLRRDYAEHLKWPGLAPEAPRAGVAQEAVDTSVKEIQEQALASADFKERVAKGFFASPVTEIFVKRTPHAALDQASVDDLTRARLLRRQGLYQKAFDIYERLVYSSPGNELLRREFAEIRELRDTQREIDQRLDPDLAEAMEKVRAIDRRIRILTQVLGQLDAYEPVL
jgi:tetratricopeptide (TPR) repeat protein